MRRAQPSTAAQVSFSLRVQSHEMGVERAHRASVYDLERSGACRSRFIRLGEAIVRDNAERLTACLVLGTEATGEAQDS